MSLVPYSSEQEIKSSTGEIQAGVNQQLATHQAKPWLLLSDIIKIAIGRVPQDVTTLLVQVNEQYLSVDHQIKVRLASTSAKLSKFVILSYSAIRSNSLSPADVTKMNTLVSEEHLAAVIASMDGFVKSSRDSLIEVQSALIKKATGGGNIEPLLTRRQQLEPQLLAKIREEHANLVQSGSNQGEMERLEFDIEYLTERKRDTKAAKARMEQELSRLNGQIAPYEDAVQAHRDERREVHGSFFVFHWKVRDEYKDNGERIAKDNLNRLLKRIAALKQEKDQADDSQLQQRLGDAQQRLGTVRGQQEALGKDSQRLSAERTALQKEFDDVVAEIESIYRQHGTRDKEAIEMITTLADGVHDGTISLSNGYSSLVGNLGLIDTHPTLLLQAVLAGLKIIRFSDEMNGDDMLERTGVSCGRPRATALRAAIQ